MRLHITPESLAVDLALARAMAKAMEDYLLSDRLYYQLVVHTPEGDRQPKLTPGVFLEHLHILQWFRDQLSPEQVAVLEEIEQTFDAVKRRMRRQYEDKVVWELQSLLRSWRWFMQDCEERLSRCRDEYQSEVWIRARMEWLMDEVPERPEVEDVRKELRVLDSKLSRVFRAGDFLWAPELAEHYPRDRFWFLYGLPWIPGE